MTTFFRDKTKIVDKYFGQDPDAVDARGAHADLIRRHRQQLMEDFTIAMETPGSIPEEIEDIASATAGDALPDPNLMDTYFDTSED